MTILQRTRKLLLPAIAVALLMTLAACGGSDAPASPSESGTTAAPATDEGTVATDRAALVAFYNAMDGDNWTNNENWLSDAPLDEWHGVATNSEGRVFNVRLTDNQLSGELPSELGSLSFLIVLGAAENQVSGEIPPELANLSYLASLELDGNQLSGEIPSGLGPRLSSLILSGNQLTGEIPPDLGNNSGLRALHLDLNQLTGKIPPELGNLSSLEYLVLSANNLSGEIPPELGNLSSLKGLDISGNNFTGEIPSELGRLSHAESLHLGGNLTGCVPRELLEIEYSNFAGLSEPC